MSAEQILCQFPLRWKHQGVVTSRRPQWHNYSRRRSDLLHRHLEEPVFALTKCGTCDVISDERIDLVGNRPNISGVLNEEKYLHSNAHALRGKIRCNLILIRREVPNLMLRSSGLVLGRVSTSGKGYGVLQQSQKCVILNVGRLP